jgi:hypothetical protein
MSPHSFAPLHRDKSFWQRIGLITACVVFIIVIAVGAMQPMSQDEADNLLGAKHVSQGAVIYRDYFSHHMPLLYYLGAPVMKVMNVHIDLVKFTFGLLSGFWILCIGRHVLKLYGRRSFYVFLSTIAAVQVPMMLGAYLAETIVALATLHFVLLFLSLLDRPASAIKMVIAALLVPIPALATASYTPISVFAALSLIYILIKNKSSVRRWFVTLAAMIFAPLLYVIYSIHTHSVGEFIEYGLRFNTTYYSQFEPSAPSGILDALLQIPQGFLGGYTQALFLGNPVTKGFALILPLVVTYIYLYHRKSTAVVLGVMAILGAVRQGFIQFMAVPPFTPGPVRGGETLMVIGILCFSILLSKRVSNDPSVAIRRYFLVPSVIVLGMIALVGVSHTLTTARANLKTRSMITVPQHEINVATTVNSILKPEETYWLGPWDFRSQLLINGNNASVFSFYLPWQAVCESCNNKIIDDFRKTKPYIIVFDEKQYDGWMKDTAQKDTPPYLYIHRHYFTVDDKRLTGFYFLNQQRPELTNRLTKLGYKV